MGYITVTNTFVTGSVFASGEMNTNFTDLINGTSDGTKDFNVQKVETKGNLTVAGNSVVGSSNSDKIYIYGRINSDLKINCHNLGSGTYPFKSLSLDNGTTDGGTIYFNGGTTSYIQSDSDANIFTIEGFSTGIKYLEDGYIRLGEDEDLELSVSTDDVIIRNRTSNKDIKIYGNDGGTDTLIAKTNAGKKIYETKERKENLNLIINGDMRIDQYDYYNTTATTVAVSGNRFIADRFHMIGLGGVAYNKYIDSNYSNAQSNFPRYAKVKVTTADASLSAGDYFVIQQIIEGYVADPVMHQTCTLSFWVRSSKTGTYGVAFQNKGAGSSLPTSPDRSYVDTYTINSADTWEYKSITVDLSGANSAGTWGTTNDIGLRIVWTLVGGSDFDTTSGSWQNGDYLKTNACVNHGDSTDNDFYLTGVQFTPTPFAMPFQHRFIDEEIELCQRYYEKSNDLKIPALKSAQNTTTEQRRGSKGGVAKDAASLWDRTIPFLTKKRSATLTAYVRNPTTGTVNQIYSPSGNGSQGSRGEGENAFSSGSATPVLTTNRLYYLNYSSDAEF